MDESVSQSVVVATPAEPDWNLVHERYLAGDELEDIAEACGTTANAISCRAYREGWKAQALADYCSDEAAVNRDVRLALVTSIYRESRMLARIGSKRNASEADTWSKVRERCIAAASKLLRWDEDPVARAKAAKCLDV
jgi:hypothetical protein